ncbi:MAG: aldehyde dehydrogenase family protein, partial [Bacteriovorax sp.]|nr:aldehyde dehydrogenase family protein [Bacteriovorax sp.]
MSIKIPAEIINCQNFINGEFVKGNGEKIQVISPYNGKPIGEFYSTTQSVVDLAISDAQIAQRSWAEISMKERTKVMFNFRNILMRDMDEIAHLKSSESGKNFDEGKAGLMKGIEVLEYAIALQNMDIGGRVEVSRGVSCEYRREPVGVVANITPFNFPAMVPMWTIPIALTLGNAYIWKPSEKTPLTSMKIAAALKEAGLPDGLFQVLQGTKETVEAIIDHVAVKAIGFVGSTKIAKAVYDRGTNLGKRVLALGGAKNHVILLPDANP